MQPDRLDHAVIKPLPKILTTNLFVLRIKAAIRNVFILMVQQVADVVKQRSGHFSARRLGLLGKVRRLQTVFEHRDAFAEVRLITARLEKIEEELNVCCHGGPHAVAS
jgi:hypothetical protein